jgi:hypothetical protein
VCWRTVLAAAGLVVAGCTAPSVAHGQPLDIGAARSHQPVGSCQARHVNTADPQAWEPDPRCTPGATDGGLTLSELCPVAHTRQIRPPASYTGELKREQMRAYGETGSARDYEEDHLIPLDLGGAPWDPANLWPEPHSSPNEKDGVEAAAHDAVCAGELSLMDAQRRIATDWYGLGRDLGVVG